MLNFFGEFIPLSDASKTKHLNIPRYVHEVWPLFPLFACLVVPSRVALFPFFLVIGKDFPESIKLDRLKGELRAWGTTRRTTSSSAGHHVRREVEQVVSPFGFRKITAAGELGVIRPEGDRELSLKVAALWINEDGEV